MFIISGCDGWVRNVSIGVCCVLRMATSIGLNAFGSSMVCFHPRGEPNEADAAGLVLGLRQHNCQTTPATGNSNSISPTHTDIQQ